MKQIQQSSPSGFQKVVYDEITATLPGGVHVDRTLAIARYPNGVLPAGVALVPHTNGTYKVVNATLSETNLAGCIGLTEKDIPIDDFPLVAVVVAATTRIDALPDKEKVGIAFLKTLLPRHTFY